MFSSMPTKPLSLAVLALLLAGCAGGAQQPAPLPIADIPAATPAPRKAQAIKAARPEELMGLNPQGLRAAMGPPSLLRRDHGAEVWQYAGKSCVLFAYLYPNPKGALQVSYLDARRKTAGGLPVSDCLTALATDRGGSPTS
jgi:hypothetical protein